MTLRPIRRLGGRLMRGWQRLEFQAWRLANHRTRRKEIRVYGRYPLWVDVADFRGYRVWRLGGTQKEKVEILAKLCAARPALVLDVGANYGEFSLIPASLGLDCIAIEPNPRVAACLRKTFAHSLNVRVLEVAASDCNSTITFHCCESATGSGSLAQAVAEREAKGFAQPTVATPVPAMRLDDLPQALETVGGRGLVMKVDVEGFEGEVLQGSSRLLGVALWWRALVEFSPACLNAAGKDADQAWRNLRRFDGRVLPQEGEAALDTLGKLPEPTPTRDVDVLIGAGFMEAAQEAQL